MVEPPRGKARPETTFFPPFFPDLGVEGRARGKAESKECLVSNSNIVQKGEREQMAVENAASKLQRKGLFWQISLFPIQAWTLWHGELRRYKEQPLFPATDYGQLASEALWEKQHETDRQTDMAASPDLSYQEKGGGKKKREWGRKAERLETAAFSWLQRRALERACPAFLIFLFSETSWRGHPQAVGLCPEGRWKRGQITTRGTQWNLLPLITKTSLQLAKRNFTCKKA